MEEEEAEQLPYGEEEQPDNGAGSETPYYDQEVDATEDHPTQDYYEEGGEYGDEQEEEMDHQMVE